MSEQCIKPRISVIGSGLVGSTFAYTLMLNGLARDIVLVDRNDDLARGVAMDLNHGLSFSHPTCIRAGSWADTEDSDIVVITAGTNRKPNQSRHDLAQQNLEVFKEIIPQLVKHTQNAVFVVVTNPVDVLTYITIKLSGLPASRVIGSGTLLDTARLKFAISQFCKVDANNVHAYIIGEHGDTELPVWSNAQIGGMPMDTYTREYAGYQDAETRLEAIFQDVKSSGKKIIEAKGATNYSIALAVQKISRSILRNENSVMPVSILIEGYYGVNDVCISIPAHITREGVDKYLKIELNDREREMFIHSANTLKSINKKLGF